MEPEVIQLPQGNPHDLLGAYALGALDDDEATAVRAYVATDAAARAELAELLAAVSALPELADPMSPPPGLRDRLAAATLAEQAPGANPVGDTLPSAPLPAPPVASGSLVRPSPSFWQRASVWASVSAALLLITLGLLFWNMQLRNDIQATPPVEMMALAPTDMAPDAHGEVKYMPQDGVLMLNVRDLPPLPEGYVYEVWLIGEGDPMPAGVFAHASAQHAIAADRSQFNTLAVTMEPGPMGTTTPTGEIYATASL